MCGKRLTGSGIGHGQEEWLLVLPRERLILELGAVDGLAASAVTSCEVTTLDHELLDDTVEDGPFVVEGLSRFANSLLASAESAEVLGRLGDEVGVELHGHAAQLLSIEADVKEHPRALGSLA